MSDMIDLIECEFKDEHSLYRAYMPFIKGGALFIRTQKTYQLKEDITLSVILPDDADSYLAQGQVVWITPAGAQGNKPVGIGVQFTDSNGKTLCHKIETILAGKLKSSTPTDTI